MWVFEVEVFAGMGDLRDPQHSRPVVKKKNSETAFGIALRAFAFVQPDILLPGRVFFLLDGGAERGGGVGGSSSCSSGYHQRDLCKLITAIESPRLNKHI